MKYSPIFMLLFLMIITSTCTGAAPEPKPTIQGITRIALPPVWLESNVSLEEALVRRRSIRDYADEALPLAYVAQLLWAAQGINSEWGGRTAPSAGALYPLEVYLVTGNVLGLEPGTYRYDPKEHELLMIKEGEVRGELAQAALMQTFIQEAAVDIVISAVYERTTRKYGDRGVRYVHMEAGHAGQNVYLQAAALDLGTVTVGAFDDEWVKEIIGMADDEAPLYIIPVGKKVGGS
ncbi:MAG: SagB/ThcOx family dehydrogenase [Dehalococcoidia bacterium]|nr:MAG: SagB/ThcOx family dehydrogenase [Dehalococcoidia bacterium]